MTTFLMQELALKEESDYKTYLDTVEPENYNHYPVNWSDFDKSWLKGSACMESLNSLKDQFKGTFE